MSNRNFFSGRYCFRYLKINIFDNLFMIISGIVGDDSVNCDKAFDIGSELLKKGTGKTFADLKMKRSERVVTLFSLAHSIMINSKKVEINTEQFFHRIIFVCNTEEEKREASTHELAPRSAALFDKDLMRKTNKASLVDEIVKKCPCEKELPRNVHMSVLDGGLLLRSKTNWQKKKTYGEISDIYVKYVSENYGKASHVVFDGYRGPPPTKSQEHERRAAMKASCRVDVQRHIPVTVSSSAFLGNGENKADFIDILKQDLLTKCISVAQAEGDADVLVVEEAIRLTPSKNKPVVIVSTDIDVLMLAITRSKINKHSLYVLSPAAGLKGEKIHNINNVQRTLGKNVVNTLLFCHAFSGCDTTSAIFNKGKASSLEILEKIATLRQKIAPFYDARASKKSIEAGGEAFFMELYQLKGLKGEIRNLNELRFLHYAQAVSQRKLSSPFKLENLPPTQASARYHSYRVYLQVRSTPL